MFKNNVIEKRVMAVVRERIQKAQEDHDTEVEALENKLETELDRLHTNHQAAKSAVADRLVGEIVNKLF